MFFRNPPEVPVVVPQLQLKKNPFAERERTVALLNTICSTKSKSQGSFVFKPSAVVGGVLWSPRMGQLSSRSPHKMSRASTDSDSNTSTENVFSPTSSPMTSPNPHSERDEVVRILTQVLVDEAEESADESDTGSFEDRDVFFDYHKQSNPHKDRDYVVFVLSDRKNANQNEIGSLNLLKRSFTENYIEQKYGSSVANLLYGLWYVLISVFLFFFAHLLPNRDEEFGFLFCTKCFDRAAREEKEKTMYTNIAAFYNHTGNMSKLLNLAVSREIHAALSMSEENARSTLFRSSSIATGLFSSLYLSGIEGSRFLTTTLKPLINKILSSQKLFETSDSDMLKSVISSFFSLLEITFLDGTFPTVMRVCLADINELLSVHFPSMVRSVLSVFLFVRCFCPVIVSPHVFGFAKDPPSGIQQKNLILVSKLLANIASGVRFDGTKEERMSVLNSLIDYFNPFVVVVLDKIVDTKVCMARKPKERKLPFLRADSKRMDLVKSLEWVAMYTNEWCDSFESELNQDQKAKLELLKICYRNKDIVK